MTMTYVIRSMSTTDWNGRDPVVPYHVYLLQPQARRGAYWSTCGEIMRFDTLEEAEEEWRRINIDKRGRTDIAPLKHPVPVWDAIHHQPE
jgi:hypothetical protein